MTLSKGQFNQVAARGNAGGFSVHLHPEVTDAKDSYMVGGVVPGRSHDAPLSGRQVASFTRSNRALLSQPNMALGGWHDEERTPKAQVDLDISQSYPRTTEGRHAAFHDTLKRNEMALGELDTAGDYTQHDNPFSTRRNSADYTKTLTSNPAAYASVVGGNVLGGMSSWAKGKG